MTTKGGSETKGGFYWKTGAWEIVTVEGNRGALPAGSVAAAVSSASTSAAISFTDFRE